jgi:2-keto-4-pentenoate hydratase/2-oxohepta-3-ene-1,7-dioic acid hydratase in catechol pathway
MAAGYSLASYALDDGQPRAGVVIGGHISPVDALLGRPGISILELLRDAAAADALAARLSSSALAAGLPVESVRLLPPVLYPGAFFCAGANYWDHLEEMAELVKRTTGHAPSMVKAPEPWFFVKTVVGTLAGHGQPIRLPWFSSMVDWEAELGVVIGRPARNISERDALKHVAGYTIVNDLSARDHVRREGSPFVYDWIGQKCFDDAAPVGPWLTPASAIPDPQDLAIRLWVSGELRQSSNTSRMVHAVSEQIAYLSRHVTLQPGDLIATGTPAGVGMPRGEFLKPGDEVRIEIEELGTLANTMIADTVPVVSRKSEGANVG